MNPNIEKIHLIGIGGIGISALARLYVHEGKQVSGTNDNESPQTLDALRQAGVAISLETTVLPEADMYVYSDAWTTLNPGIIEQARATGKPVKDYFAALAEVANEYYLIAVAGTHGKSTTTAMVIDILAAAEYDPSGVVGALRAKSKSNFRAGKSKYFVVEACEYRRHFLHFKPDVLVITNLEHEHVDYYSDLADVQSAFRELANRVPSDGAVIADTADVNLVPVLDGLTVKVIDYRAQLDLTLKLTQPGMHNRLNAAAASAAAGFIGIDSDRQHQALEHFAGTARRFEYRGACNDAAVYDDYAHHPTEITAAISGARELYPNKTIVAVFQPHTYSRTKELFADFARALGLADRVLLVPIYAARETNDTGVSSRELAVKALEYNKNVQFYDSLDAAAAELARSLTRDDVVLVLGAGDVTKVSDRLVA